MYDENNIFAKILRREIPCDKVYEDEFSLFFNDIAPQAKIHVLGIPKFPCTTYSDFLKIADNQNILSFFKSVEIVINKLKINQNGYRLITNAGKDGGQEVPHFHIHILAGEKIGTLR
ncbi:HIT domain-containing protein [Pelagibacteraceae bacterium]|nr:HIT domain-containing protein [Pelagibacteraceae bacterium]